MKTRIALSLAVLLGGAGLAGCGGSDGSSPSCAAAPLALTQGPWCITMTSTTSSPCVSTLAAPFWVDLTQTGAALEMTSPYVITYTGTVCGSTATVVASAPPADVVNTIVFTGADAGSGSAQWNTGTCSGTDTFTAASGYCP
jgi:hypothetical protein